MIKINKTQIYQVGVYEFKNFLVMNNDEKRIIWQWRNDENIRQWMSNKDMISYESHLLFIENLKEREDVYYWLVYKNNMPVGVFDMVDVNLEKGQLEPGYYLNPQSLNSGEGLFFNYAFRNFIFNILGFSSVVGRILLGNERAFLISTFFGVRPVSIFRLNETLFVEMLGTRTEFSTLNNTTLLQDFVKYVKQNKINWDELKRMLGNE